MALSTAEPGYAALPQFAFRSAYGFSIGGAFGGLAETGGAFVAPSAYSEFGFRYRGFESGNLLIGAYYRRGPFAFSALGGASLARYILSDSYFVFPIIEARVDYVMLRIDNANRLMIGLAVPLFLRADSLSAGLGLRLTWAQSMTGTTSEARP